jgi:hypothetical protein
MLEAKVRSFPEQLRLERTAASAQVEALHSSAVASAIFEKSAEFERQLRQEKLLTQQAESELKAALDRCDAMQQQLLQLTSQADAISGMMQAQAARADEATAKWREAEAAVQQCRHAMQLDADRLQVLCGGAFSVYKLPLF